MLGGGGGKRDRRRPFPTAFEANSPLYFFSIAYLCARCAFISCAATHTPRPPPPPRNTLRKMAAASAVDLPGRTSGSMQERLAAMSEATEAAAAATKAAAARRIRNELSRKHVRLRVERSKTQRHVFHTKLSTGIVNIANGCRRERALLSRDEEDADLSLYYEVR